MLAPTPSVRRSAPENINTCCYFVFPAANNLNLDVRFKNQGLDLIEVQDNGSGISPSSYASVALKHHTSKLSTYDDLATLHTFGFRGEALASLCALSYLNITTCLEQDAPKGTRLTFEASGKLADEVVVASQRGTTVAVEKLFHNLPVRRRELERNIKREWHKVIALLNQYACIQTSVKFSVSQQPNRGKRLLLFSTKGNPTTRENIINIFGAKTTSALVPLDILLEMQPSAVGPDAQSVGQRDQNLSQVRVLGHVSRPVHGEGRQMPDRQMFFVNGRPCGLPQFAKTFNEVYKSYNYSQSPFILADIQLDTTMYDVNVSPDKRSILLHDQKLMLDRLRSSLAELFDSHDYSLPTSQLMQASKSAVNTPLNKRKALSPAPGPARVSETLVESEAMESDGTGGGSSDRFQSDGEASTLSSNVEKLPQSRDSQMRQKSLSKWLSSDGKAPTKSALAAAYVSAGSSDLVRVHRTSSKRERSEDTHDSDISSERSTPSSIEKDSEIVPAATLHTRTVPNPAEIGTRSKARISESPGSQSLRSQPQRSANIAQRDSSLEKSSSNILPPLSNPSVITNLHHSTGQTTMDMEDETSEVSSPISEASSGSAISRESAENAQPEQALAKGVSSATKKPIDNIRVDCSDNDPEDKAIRPVDSPFNSSSPVVTPSGDPSDALSVTEGDTLAEADGDADHSLTALRGNILESGPRRKYATVQDMQHVILDERTLARMSNRCATTATKEDAKQPNPQVEDISAPDAESRLPLIIAKDDFYSMRVVGQFNLGFIIAVRPRSECSSVRGFARHDELFIIDQHASDEKYNFERLQSSTVVQSQRLVHPKTLDLTALEEEIVIENLTAIEANGFKIHIDSTGQAPVGRRCQLIALPLSRETTFDLKDLEELIALLADGPYGPDHVPRPSKVRKMFAMRACRSSIMIGKALSHAQMYSTLRNMGQLDKPWNCPHGRPTMRHLSRLQAWDEQRWRGDTSCHLNNTHITWLSYCSSSL